MTLSFERIRAEIPVQTAGFLALAESADFDRRVPSCPEWTHGDLVRHVGRMQSIVIDAILAATGAQAGEPLTAPDDVPEAELIAWVHEVCARLTVVIETSPADATVENFGLEESVVWWSRRVLQDVVIHRADAAQTVGEPYELDTEIAVDGVDELLDVLATVRGIGGLVELRGSGVIHLHATDTEAEWLVELNEKGFTWKRGHDKGEVALRGPLTEILLALYRRQSLDDGKLEVLGDAELLDFWLDNASIG
ncbi:maleylpyruvate isomerase family mycothiol-dependent enzyme [Phytomonospora sp. NPDC050363]|uniref:maleylpyruvate isomerase family mycothiol-dependent enzyme n=1 Tax=Phytomonospora sp. NPDC050363 TaxID=3155642 RepID=UPI0033E18E65